MPDDTGADAALHDFIGDLRAAFERAGPPTYGRLEKLSERCHAGAPTGGPRILVLAHSTTHDILSGKRDKLPPWPWVSSFLQVLRVAATENGLDSEAIGPTSQWHTRYLAARAALQPEPLAAPVPEPAEPASGEEETGPASTVPPLEPTTMLRRYVEAYGRTGMRLLRHAEADDGRDAGVPAYRLATLLACENRPNEALYWLQRAARAGHPLALRLATEWDPRTDPWPPYYWRKGQAAFDVGMEYEAAGQPHAAAVFFDRAAGNGHAEAAYRAGLNRMQRGQQWEAMLLFNRAAEAGYAPAEPELDGLLPRYHDEFVYWPSHGPGMPRSEPFPSE